MTTHTKPEADTAAQKAKAAKKAKEAALGAWRSRPKPVGPSERYLRLRDANTLALYKALLDNRRITY